MYVFIIPCLYSTTILNNRDYYDIILFVTKCRVRPTLQIAQNAQSKYFDIFSLNYIISPFYHENSCSDLNLVRKLVQIENLQLKESSSIKPSKVVIYNITL